MRRWLAFHISRRLLSYDAQGRERPPGGDECPVLWTQADASTVSLIAQGDAFDLFIGKEAIYRQALTRQVALKLAFWLLSWWVFKSWCDIKHRLWYWSISVMLDERLPDPVSKSIWSKVAVGVHRMLKDDPLDG